jgi:hypothetical protein
MLTTLSRKVCGDTSGVLQRARVAKGSVVHVGTAANHPKYRRNSHPDGVAWGCTVGAIAATTRGTQEARRMNSSRYRLPVRLALVCAACAIALGAHAAAPDAPMAGSVAQPGNPLWTIPLNTLTATRERPLFTPSRRPPMQAAPAAIVSAPPPPPPAAEPEQLGLRLLGTIAGREGGIAICLNVATSAIVRVRTAAGGACPALAG